MTIQKAMRVRSELKKKAAMLNDLIDSVKYALEFEGSSVPADDVIEKRNENLFALDGMTYAQAAQKLFAIIEACEELNMKIEEVNKKGHNLLFKETALKSKLSFIEKMLVNERNIVPYEKRREKDYNNLDANGNPTIVEKEYSSYPILDSTCFGMELVDLRNKLNAEIEDVRDQLQVFNATANVDFVLPENLV